jgi:hypothetical protein
VANKIIESLERFAEAMRREEHYQPEPLHYVSSDHFARMEQYLVEHPNATAAQAMLATMRKGK